MVCLPYLGVGKFGSTSVPFNANCKVDEFWISSPRLMLNQRLENLLHVQKTSHMEKRQTPETREFRLGSINLEDLSGPGIFSSFSLNSLLVTDVWVSEVTVFTVQGDQTFARC